MGQGVGHRSGSLPTHVAVSPAICDEAGTVVAAGRSNYSSADVDKIKGLQSSEARSIVDNDYGDEVIHRNNLVLVDHDSDQDE